jgi:multicopper oxidase
MSEKYGRFSKSLRGLSRRDFLTMAGLGAGAVALGGCGALGSRDEGGGSTSGSTAGGGGATEYAFDVAPRDVEIGDRTFSTWGYDGGLPGPEIRIKQGDTLRVRLGNRIPEGTTIHWHGQPIVNEMDGVPDVTQPPIESGEDFVYEFVVPASGTYFYHSHVGMQLDRAAYGPLIVEPENETVSSDREFTLMLDDWLDGVDGRTPEDELENLRSGGSEMAGMDMGGGMEGMEGMEGMGGGGGEPARTPPDTIYPYYLINGRPPENPEELEVEEGERVRLRLINSSSATIYRVALAGHRLSVTHTDGQPIEPVEADVVRLGPGERYDVIVEADNPGVWQLAAEAEGTEKLARAVFRYGGEEGDVPPAEEMPSESTGELLLYEMLRAAPEAESVPGGEPDEVVRLVLDGDEETYVWTINDQVFEEADRIEIARDDKVRFEFENRSHMPHPMHLHGHFFRVDNGTGEGPIKDTVMVEPMQTLAVDWLADNPGPWALHCHLIYHQEGGMMRVVNVA